MKLVTIVFGIWLTLSIGSTSWLLSAPLDENIHELDMTVLCDSFEVNGNFDLEFNSSRSYPIWGSKNPIPINFRNLHIETKSIIIDDRSLNSMGEKVRIEAQESKPRLYIYKEPSTSVHEIYISRIKAATKDAEIGFSATAGETYVSIGKDSIIHLENEYLNWRNGL